MSNADTTAAKAWKLKCYRVRTWQLYRPDRAQTQSTVRARVHTQTHTQTAQKKKPRNEGEVFINNFNN